MEDKLITIAEFENGIAADLARQTLEDFGIKAVVTGDNAQIKAVVKLEKINELKKQGVKIAFKIKANETILAQSYIQKTTYKKRLLETVTKDPDCKKWFHTLFV